MGISGRSITILLFQLSTNALNLIASDSCIINVTSLFRKYVFTNCSPNPVMLSKLAGKTLANVYIVPEIMAFLSAKHLSRVEVWIIKQAFGLSVEECVDLGTCCSH